MVDRPLEDRRPVGPLMDIDLDRGMGDKIQLGVAGTAMPNAPKSPLNVLFVLNKTVATLPTDIKGTLGEKIRSKFDEESSPTIEVKRSGSSSKAPFPEQAVIVRFRGDDLPVQQTQLNRVANTIQREYSGIDAKVDAVILDTE